MTSNNIDLVEIPAGAVKRAEDIGVAKSMNPAFKSFLLAIVAGVFISIAFVFYTTVTVGAESMSFGMSRFVGGLAFSLGLMLVVICGGELFTSSVLTIISRASARISTADLLRNWSIVYVGNMVGAGLFVLLIWSAQQHLAGAGQWGIHAMTIAQHKLQYSFIQAVSLGILCNIMVCLAIWMTFSCQSVTDKLLVLILPISMFVASGFEHSIANMFMVPLGILIQQFASPEYWILTGSTPANFADLTLNNFLINNLIPVTLGNILGGMSVGLIYWLIYRKPELSGETQQQNTAQQESESRT